LKTYGGKFDVVLLSAGEDGHIGSLFPNHDSIKNDEEGYILVENSPKLPEKRISASRKLIEKSENAILVFFGEGKGDAYEMFKDENTKVEECPAKLVEGIESTTIFSDVERIPEQQIQFP